MNIKVSISGLKGDLKKFNGQHNGAVEENNGKVYVFVRLNHPVEVITFPVLIEKS